MAGTVTSKLVQKISVEQSDEEIKNSLHTVLDELKTIYSMEDAMDMYEAFVIPKFNEWRELESAKRSKK